MKAFIVSYDLIGNQSPVAYQNVREYITTRFLNWARPLQSVYIVKSSLTALQIATDIRTVLHPNDEIIVMELGKDWWVASMPEAVVAWLKTNI